MMFANQGGCCHEDAPTVYLRPETAGGIFVNYKNVVDSLHPKLPFGIAINRQRRSATRLHRAILFSAFAN